MHIAILAAAHHAGQHPIPHGVAVAILSGAIAFVVVLLFKGIVKLLSPKKKSSKSGSSYAYSGSKK